VRRPRGFESWQLLNHSSRDDLRLIVKLLLDSFDIGLGYYSFVVLQQ
jgi:hypothetical protein